MVGVGRYEGDLIERRAFAESVADRVGIGAAAMLAHGVELAAEIAPDQRGKWQRDDRLELYFVSGTFVPQQRLRAVIGMRPAGKGVGCAGKRRQPPRLAGEGPALFETMRIEGLALLPVGTIGARVPSGRPPRGQHLAAQACGERRNNRSLTRPAIVEIEVPASFMAFEGLRGSCGGGENQKEHHAHYRHFRECGNPAPPKKAVCEGVGGPLSRGRRICGWRKAPTLTLQPPLPKGAAPWRAWTPPWFSPSAPCFFAKGGALSET